MLTTSLKNTNKDLCLNNLQYSQINILLYFLSSMIFRKCSIVLCPSIAEMCLCFKLPVVTNIEVTRNLNFMVSMRTFSTGKL